MTEYIKVTKVVTDNDCIGIVRAANKHGAPLQVPDVLEKLGLSKDKYWFIQRRMNRLVRYGVLIVKKVRGANLYTVAPSIEILNDDTGVEIL